jgi:uncharacterized protein YlbG (UPF0298 family)
MIKESETSTKLEKYHIVAKISENKYLKEYIANDQINNTVSKLHLVKCLY